MECGATSIQSAKTFSSELINERMPELKRRSETIDVDRVKWNRKSTEDQSDSGFYASFHDPASFHDEASLPSEICGEKTETTNFDNLPLEVLDEILQKACLLMMFGEVRSEDDKCIIMTLASVDYCWFKRIIRKRFKKTMWRHLRVYYEKERKESSKYLSILQANRYYLEQTIQHDERYRLIRMLSTNVLTENQAYFLIRRLPLDIDKTRELLFFARSFDDTQFTILIECLRKTSQRQAVELLEKGGVAVKVIVQNEKVLNLKSKEKDLVQKLRELQDATIQRSCETDKLLNTLTSYQMKIIHAMHNHGIELWIWCQSRGALEKLRLMSKSNALFDLLSKLFRHLVTDGAVVPKAVIVHREQFKKDAVSYRIEVKLTKTISLREEKECVRGVTKLHNNIYVLCESNSYAPNSIYVYEDRSQFRFLQRFKLRDVIQPWDIAASPVGNCLYITDCAMNCIWKIRPKAKFRVTKWLDLVTLPWTLSVQKNGHVLITRHRPLRKLEVYRTNGTLYSDIILPLYIDHPHHAVQTSAGNYVVMEQVISGVLISSISQVSIDGRILRCMSQDEVIQQLRTPSHIFIDSADRVFLVDSGKHRVILLDSKLNWSGILLSNEESEVGPDAMPCPVRLFYDEKKKQLAVGGQFFGLNIYTMSQQEEL